MITIKARINLSENGGTISSISSNINGNNISADLSEVLGKKSVAVGNPFILGKSKLGSGATYADNLPYLLSRQLSNSNGEFANPYTITVNGNNITQFIISFDTKNGAFPKKIIVDGEEVRVDDDAMWEIVVDKASSHTITISNWNKPNSPLIITRIYADMDIEIDRNNLLSFNSDMSDRSNIQYPTYGIVSNRADISFSDYDEQVLDLITQKLLHSGIEISVKVDNDILNEQEQVCLMYIQSLSYDSDNRRVDMSLQDRLVEWQDINVSAIYYTPTVSTPKTAEWFYRQLYNTTKSNLYDIFSFEELDSETKNVLTNTTIEYPLLESSSLWDEWTKLCELCLLHIWQDSQGKIVVKYSGAE